MNLQYTKTSKSTQSICGFEASLRTALKFISNPLVIWDTGQLKNRHAVLKLAFPKGLQYCKNKEFRIAEKPLIFKVLGRVKNCERKMAEWTGLEPATTGVTGRYSNQLNYHSK